MSAGKITEGKLNYELYWEFITLLAERMQKGKKQYKAYSWKEPTDIEELKQAYWRHTLEIMKGNYLDDGQQYGHLGAATANLMMIYYQLKREELKQILQVLRVSPIEIFDSQKNKIRELVEQHPNNMDLGEAIRKLVK